MTKYTGKQVEVTWDGDPIPCTNIRAVTIDENRSLVDSTGACDDYNTYIENRTDVDWSMELIMDTDPTVLFDFFNLATGGHSMVVYPHGNTIGQRMRTCYNATVSKRSEPVNYNNLAVLTVSGKAGGGFTNALVY